MMRCVPDQVSTFRRLTSCQDEEGNESSFSGDTRQTTPLCSQFPGQNVTSSTHLIFLLSHLYPVNLYYHLLPGSGIVSGGKE